MELKKYLPPLLVAVSLAFAFMLMAFVNGFPLVTSDTGSYINNGFMMWIPADRPLFYSLFLRVFELGISLWIPLWIQAFGVSVLFGRMTFVLLGEDRFNWKLYLLGGIATVAFTSVSWFVSQLMPDFFTGLMGMALLLFFLDRLLWARLGYLVIIMGSALVHYANIFSLLLIALCLILLTYLLEKKKLKMVLGLLGTGLACLLIIVAMHAVRGHGLILSKGSHVFLIGKLSENGILQRFLEENCGKKTYALCPYRDQLPNKAYEYVWNSQSPLYLQGGWEETKESDQELLGDLWVSPSYYWEMLRKGVRDSFIQLFSPQLGDGLRSYEEGSAPYYRLGQYYPEQLEAYASSRQNRGELTWGWANFLYISFLILSMIGVVYLAVRGGMPDRYWWAYLIIVLLLVFNAIVTANLANVLARLSARVWWTLPMVNILYLLDSWGRKIPVLGGEKS